MRQGLNKAQLADVSTNEFTSHIKQIFFLRMKTNYDVKVIITHFLVFIVHDETFQDNSSCGEGSFDVFHLHGQNE